MLGSGEELYVLCQLSEQQADVVLVSPWIQTLGQVIVLAERSAITFLGQWALHKVRYLVLRLKRGPTRQLRRSVSETIRDRH